MNNQKNIIRTIRLIRGKKLNPKNLAKNKQNLIIEYLRYEQCWSQTRIAQLLRIVPDTVRSRLRKIDEAYKNTLIARGFDIWTIIADVERKKEIVQQKAANSRNWSLVWKAETDYIGMLSKLGLIQESKIHHVYTKNEDDRIDVKKIMKFLESPDLESISNSNSGGN